MNIINVSYTLEIVLQKFISRLLFYDLHLFFEDDNLFSRLLQCALTKTNSEYQISDVLSVVSMTLHCFAFFLVSARKIKFTKSCFLLQ